MAQDEAKQSLLLDTVDGNNAMQIRRRITHPCPAPSRDINSQPLLSNGSTYTKTHLSFKKILIVLGAYLGVGTLCFYLVRHEIEGKKTNGLVDALYFCVVTMTTVGFGDLVPRSNLARLLACVYVFIGMALGGLFLGKAADRIVGNQEALLVRAIHTHENLVTQETVKDVETHELKYKFIMAISMMFVLVITGMLVLSYVEELGFIGAFYCVCCTVTTLGYGDESFSTEQGRIFAVFWMLSSTLCLAQCYCYMTELHAEKKQKEMVKWVFARQLTFSDLEQADLDQDKVVNTAEFILYKLKEMGKIEQTDILPLMEKFRDHDTDQSGTLTAQDLISS